ncbi:glycosyltransferase [Massilia terrae]|uniref:Glycosyltransferase n=1 Tax=Massilia terrae TaxID=1811224 RepID=A0ABT2CR74_9BURK|nr:glycosyltransferase [Massilia terrae]MCS0656475.1 glycosyltransferase [Massilia terrae]
MKFTFVTYGTDGDTRPLVALAGELIGRGHQVHLLSDISGAALARAHGVPFTALAGSMRDSVLPGGALSAIMQDGGDFARITRACAQIAKDNTAAWMATTREVAQGSDVLLFAGLAAFVGLAVAEELDIPCIGAAMWPMTPTREFAAAFMRPRRLPGWANRMTHQLFTALTWTLFRPAVNAARRQLFGAAPRRRMWQGYPVLYGCSPALVPRPADWPANVELCGAWRLPLAPDWQAPEELAHFLAAGAPPVYVGFGSMAGFDRAKLLRALVDAVGPRRVLFYPGWSGIDLSQLPPNFHVLRDTPHDWLFPRTSLVVHHGGAGTTHAAARAGVPSVVVPFAGDQFFWASRVQEAGIGRARGAARVLDGDALMRMMEAATTPSARRNACAMAARMRHEDGVGHAADRLLGGAAARLR